MIAIAVVLAAVAIAIGLFSLFALAQLRLTRDEDYLSFQRQLNERGRPTVTLDEDERRALQAQLTVRWDDLVCKYCGGMHAGLCARIRHQRIERSPSGECVDTVFWRGDQWEHSSDTIMPAEVFGTRIVRPDGEQEPA